MPKNLNATVIKLPTKVLKGEKPDFKINNDLNNIYVSLVNAPKLEDLCKFIPGFVEATWSPDLLQSKLSYGANKEESLQKVKNMFAGKTLPTALESIKLTFLITGISTQDVTHILRHRDFSFSFRCNGDRDLRHDDYVIPEAIENNPEFKERYEKIIKEAAVLYADMSDSELISIMDARLILPKAHAQECYASIDFRNLIPMLKQRLDEEIQPASDNILALLMWEQVCAFYPIACLDLLDLNSQDKFYISQAQSEHSTRLYAPSPKNDVFEWHPDSNIYGSKTRKQVSGIEGEELIIYDEIKNDILEHFDFLRRQSTKFWSENEYKLKVKKEEGVRNASI